jgi:hypothetical protein
MHCLRFVGSDAFCFVSSELCEFGERVLKVGVSLFLRLLRVSVLAAHRGLDWLLTPCCLLLVPAVSFVGLLIWILG